MNGESPPASYCPAIEGFCTALTCSSCNALYTKYKDVLWVCGTCADKLSITSAYKIIEYTCVSVCSHCDKETLVNGYVPLPS